MTEARAFWTVAPGRGEIRGETLPPLARISAGAHAGQRRVARHRGAGVRRSRAAEPVPGDARAADGRRVPVSGEIRLQRRRPRLTDGQARLRAASAPGRFPRTRRDVHSRARRRADAACGAGGQHGDGAERGLGCRAACRRAHAGDRRRCRRVCWPRRCWHASPARASPWWTSIQRAKPLARRFGCDFAFAGSGAARAGADRACIGQRSGAASGAGPRRLRGAHRRGKLVRRSRARGAARRGVPCAAAAPDRDAGRCRRTADARPAQSCRASGARARTAGRCRATTRCWTGRRGSRICRRRCRASSRRAACATSSPMGRSECSA